MRALNTFRMKGINMSCCATMTCSGLRPVISIIGDTNSGKSSLLNKIIGQNISIVSDICGTTTDAVMKAYELIGFGAVSFYDTAGLNDHSILGEQRIIATKKIIDRSDVVIVVIGKEGVSPYLSDQISKLDNKKIPYIKVYNFGDVSSVNNHEDGILVSAVSGDNIELLKDKLVEILKSTVKDVPLVSDLVKKNDTIVLVCPIDEAAPKGKLIMPQIQVLREALDNDAVVMITKENTLQKALDALDNKPDFVISDSQVIKEVAQTVPQDIPLTSFSTLFARYKGDFDILLDGVKQLDNLNDGDKVLVAEGCAHRVTCNDIGRIKIPNMIMKYTNKDLTFDFVSGVEFPDNIDEYALVVHCGGCMLTRLEVVRRLHECSRKNIKITNYGILISKIQGVLDRVVKNLK